jgi:hypothetical protein
MVEVLEIFITIDGQTKEQWNGAARDDTQERGACQAFVELQSSLQLIKLSEMPSVDAAPRGKAIDDQLRGLSFFNAAPRFHLEGHRVDRLLEIRKLEEASR